MNQPGWQLPKHLAAELINVTFTSKPTDDETVLIVGHARDLSSALTVWANEHDETVPNSLAIDHPDPDEEDQGWDLPIQYFSADFVTGDFGQFEYVIVSPPHALARRLFDVNEIRNRFPQLHGSVNAATVFLLHALEHLAPNGRLTILLPSRFLSANADADVRRLLVEEFHMPAIIPVTDQHESLTAFILVVEGNGSGPTEIPDGLVDLPTTGENWGPFVAGATPPSDSELTLGDITEQIGPGIATGADDTFVVHESDLPPQIEVEWVYPAVGGGTLAGHAEPSQTPLRVICPYDAEGTIIPFDRLGDGVQAWLKLHEETLRSRASIKGRGTPWYGWSHDPPLKMLLRPKILIRDFATDIEFWLDEAGEVIPRRTVYYIIPDETTDLHDLIEYLRTEDVRNWLEALSLGGNRGLRVSTRDLQNLPVPNDLPQSHN